MANQQRNADIAEFFAVKGWKRGLKCTEIERMDTFAPMRTFYCRHHKTRSHDIDAPNLIADPWALLMALWSRGYYFVPCLYDRSAIQVWQHRSGEAPECVITRLNQSKDLTPAIVFDAAGQVMDREKERG